MTDTANTPDPFPTPTVTIDENGNVILTLDAVSKASLNKVQ